MTRSISIWRPMTGSSLPSSALEVRSTASWSTIGVLARVRFGRRRDRRCCAGLGQAGHVQHTPGLAADLFAGNAQAPEDIRRTAFGFTHQPEQQMLRSDIVMAQLAGFVDGVLNDVFGAFGEFDVIRGNSGREGRSVQPFP